MKTVLITGGNKGIGFETAKQLSKLGYKVYIGCRSENNALEALKSLKNQGLNSVDWIQLDVADSKSIEQGKIELASKIDSLDILINNAGISGIQPQKFCHNNIKTLRNIFDTNFFGTVEVTQEFFSLLKKAEQPIIINISSEVASLEIHSSTGKDPNLEIWSAYGASKTAVNAFTVMLANELEDSPFKVFSVTPGYTSTDLNDHQGTKTVEEGATPIVKIANKPTLFTSGKFYGDQGEVSW
ncbi:SDR family NAD(P)-dependent oxidoreductase [Zunongwangia endophytica]|uniref:SDR family NAD(P)-dependent oxidoreductase n=1 Tax=Zunongwangia endophytica TaxID=1808945 RepID=A0ABV8HE23_9FLAO|nr:SDR family NAD(P)-dependent oxidoreductase [Zunongwangia endophytica]MDN3594334.1 SDR family NAD(P)-dependent oxidoreductase [Zunongwangia endophytica]